MHNDNVIQHPGEDESNAWRSRLLAVEPRGQRTFTPSLAVIARSAGSYHWTTDGRRLADFTSGVLVANLGHNPAEWWRSVWKYMGLQAAPTTGARDAKTSAGDAGVPAGFLAASPLTAYNAATPIEVLASERLIANLRGQAGGARCERILWAASGSEAIQKAIWAGWAFAPERSMILATRHGFHGKKGMSGAVTGGESDRERDGRVRFLSFPREACQSMERRAEPLDLAPYRAELASLWKEHGAKLGMLVTEPYLGGGGSYHPQKEYLQLLQSFCREHELLFILDEVQSNFGRTGEMYAFTAYGLEPDLVVLGKGMGNGVAVDAVAGRADVLGALAYGEGSDTWSGWPLGAAAVLATLDAFESSDVLEHAKQLSQVIIAGLQTLAQSPLVAAVRGEGMVFGVEFAEAAGESAGAVAAKVVEACYRGDAQGRAIHLLGPLAGRVLRIAPPLTMPIDEARDYLDAMVGMVAQVAESLSGATSPVAAR